MKVLIPAHPRRRAGVAIVSLALAGAMCLVGTVPQESAHAAEAVVLPNSGYTLINFDSEADPYPAPPSLDGTAKGAFDGDYETQWASRWASDPAPMPHHLTFDIGAEHALTALGYSVKNQGNGPAADVQVYVTTDAAVAADPSSTGWSRAAAATLHQPSSNTEVQRIAFDGAVRARYVMLVISSAVNGSANASASEVVVYTTDRVDQEAPRTESLTASPYTVNVDGVHPEGWNHAWDAPAALIVDEKGDFHLQQAHALYKKTDPRAWTFWNGTDIDSIRTDEKTSKSGTNPDTTQLCNTSPTGRESTRDETGRYGHSEANYCDLINMWVDPDTGDWYGLVHNEFTPNPFGEGYHYDSIDYAVSRDKGMNWTIVDHAITSPYSTARDDNAAFPQSTYYYGDGDPRLYADYASGYFYMFYGSRVLNKASAGGGWVAFHAHVARAPISGKMAKGTWRKWYNGQWSEPGVGGKESNMIPVTKDAPTGYTEPKDEYDPAKPGTAQQQIARGDMPPTSPLFVMDITYNAYLGLYIGQPETRGAGDVAQKLFATRDLSSQRWFELGDTGDYTNASWYRWFLDPGNKTSSAIVGRSFRSYCSFFCQTVNGARSHDEYIDLTITGDASTAYTPVDTSKTYTIANGDGLLLTEAEDGSLSGAKAGSPWTFTAIGDGSYMITNASGKALGIDSTTMARAWDTPPTLRSADSNDAGQQWWVIPSTSPDNGSATGELRLINRYSNLALGMSNGAALTTPQRSWDRDVASKGVSSTLEAVSAQSLTLVEYSSPTPPPSPKVGWEKDGGGWRYRDADGSLATGWLQDGGAWYYLRPDGTMATGWVEDGGAWYALKDNGAMRTGWFKDGGAWYYLRDNGAMATGWVKDGGKWYHLAGGGAMTTGWIRLAGSWYHLGAGGAMTTGWLQDGGSWYYLRSDGSMATGWVVVGPSRYYMDPSTGAWRG